MRKNKSLDDFIEYDLNPALFGCVDKAFPSLDFQRKARGWASTHHLNGDEDKAGNVVTYVYTNAPYMAIDHARSEKKRLINLYMELNGKDFTEALKDLAELCYLESPIYEREEYREREQRVDSLERANAAFTSALWEDTEEARKVREYLHSRKWTDEEIKRGGLGLITPKVISSLPDGNEYRIATYGKHGELIAEAGKTHLLVWAYRNGSRIFGFKFREVCSKEESTGQRFLNTKGMSKGKGFYNMPSSAKDITIVESELDANLAELRGVDGIVATAGGTATDTQIEDALRRGVERFTLLFDNDSKGDEFTRSTIERLQETGKSIFVASIPKQYKDIGDFLAEHRAEELKGMLDKAEHYSHYVLREEIVKKYQEREDKSGVFTLKDREEFFAEVERLLNSDYIKPYERKDIYKFLTNYEDSLNFKVSDFKEWADKAFLRKMEATRAEETRKGISEAQALAESGKIEEALKAMRRTSSEQSAKEKALEFASVFSPSSPDEYGTFLSEIKEGVPTGYKFEQRGQKEPLTLNAGLTFICGYRGHGKTSFLNNIALNDARRNLSLQNGKSVLYFSYEVDKRRLIVDLLNTFVNDKDISANPSNSIISYFKGKGEEYFRKDRREDGKTHYQYFEERKSAFLRDYLSSGALVIADENYKVGQLLDAIKYYVSTRKVSIVCIDYAQLIYSEDYSRLRTEEIKQIVNDIKDFANKEGIPFVMAAQFNREVDSPISVDTKNIGEGGDFERIADTCIGLFNLKELHPLPKNSDEEKAAKKLLSDLGVATYGQGEELRPIKGKLFVRLMKRRYGYYPLDTILEWEGRTKHIAMNDEGALLSVEQGSLFDIEEEEDDLPF